VIAATSAVALLAGAVVGAFTIEPLGVFLHLRPDPRDLAVQAGTAFLNGWQDGDYAAMQAQVIDPEDDMERVYGGMAERLGVTGTVVEPAELDKAGTGLPYTVTLTLGDLGEVSWQSTVHLSKANGTWKVAFTSDTVYPGLDNGQRINLLTTSGERGQILDRNGRSLNGDADLASNLVGKDGSEDSDPTGLQRVLDSELGGIPNSRLVIEDITKDAVLDVIQRWDEVAGTDVRTTIDLDMQRAAHKALSEVSGTAALVAIDTSTGEIRALASQPTTGLASAFASYYAPGSTFKIVTSTAAMLNGATPDSKVRCSPTILVDGRTYKNAEDAPDQEVSLEEAFAESCNTAFIRLGQQLPDGALQQAAELYGFNGSDPLPVSSAGGKIPAPTTATEFAADTIGQGKVEASPLQMASVAAAVASGTWHQPHVISDCPDCLSHEITVAESLHPLMRSVVTHGTGTVANRVSGGPVYAKTGTAEFGSKDPPQTHAWFVGWQGDLAFAVFVNEGKYGGTVAAPIAVDFLNAVNG
jgi:cell division protein FtsI/penicillin-binding protein 2